jgi:undecaprenyl-phosphate 4-deoxy-4-formamido-L-arabinose transferase
VTISIVVPVYRSQAILRTLHEQVVAAVSPLDAEFEFILVEDDGRDGSWDVIESLADQDRRVHGIRLLRNSGQHNALLCGIRAATRDIVVTIDDDLQNPPDQIPILLEQFKLGHDVVYGTPQREQHGFLRNIASRITKLALASSMGAATAANISAFRAFRRPLRDAFADFRGPTANIDVLLTWGTTRFTTVKVRHDPRRIGKSNYSIRKLVHHTMNMMTGFSAIPLQLASIAGIVLGLMGFAVLAFVVGRFALYGSDVPGFTFLAAVIAIFSGAQLLAIGVFGEYLARMHFRSMDRPPYAVAERTADQ